MKEALTNILALLLQNSTFVAEISADVTALKSVVYALGPAARVALDEQLAVERNKIRSHVEAQKLMIEALRAGLSQIQN